MEFRESLFSREEGSGEPHFLGEPLKLDLPVVEVHSSVPFRFVQIDGQWVVRRWRSWRGFRLGEGEGHVVSIQPFCKQSLMKTA